MRFDVITLFPEIIEAVVQTSIIGRALKSGLVEIHAHQLRDYAFNKHKRVDDSPYGGGFGMVMQCEPIYQCYKAIKDEIGEKPFVIYMSPQGKVLNQSVARDILKIGEGRPICILCGHYEGVDERILESIVDMEISVGDYVLTGGELPACVLIDCVTRMSDGVLPDPECFEDESHFSGLLEYPQYTKPEIWEEKSVPPVLLSGHHKNITEWRHEKAVEVTRKKRPDLLENL
ncbi:MAG: tRNA (guanosine(37)-N1)-methyltransferase TrmD [Ruminococcus sp.]|nr:tRNA (guanosine(37)-N1)-methyltransferase TrmD [Ruminococcus sp.]